MKKSEKLSFLARQPENDAGMYIEAKHDKFFVKERDMNRPADSIQLLYVRNLREFEKIETLKSQLLALNKEIAAKNQERLEYMQEKSDKLRQHFIDTNTFMDDALKKKAVAEERIKIAEEAHQKIRSTIENYGRQISDLTSFQSNLKDIVAELEPYEQIIKEVVQKSDVMFTLKDCMDRCDALSLAQKDISRLKEEKIREIENMRAQMMNFTADAAIKVLGMKNKLSELTHMYERATVDCQQWEQVLIETQNVIINDTLSKERCLNGIALTYRLLAKRLKKPPQLHHNSDVEKMLDFIKDEVEILTKTLVELKLQE